MRRAIGLAALLMLSSHAALARTHWDGSVLAGGALPLSEGPEKLHLGPSVLLAGHVATLPLLRTGLYANLSDMHVQSGDARKTMSGGLSLRIASPWRPTTLKLHLRTGFGFGGAWQQGRSGQQFEVPLFVQMSGALGEPSVMNPTAKPVEWTLALGSHLRFGDSGALYERAGASAAPSTLELLAGLSFDM